MNQIDQALLVAQDDVGAGAIIPMFIGLTITIALIAGIWKTFEKAGKPGWAAIVPFYNLIVMLEIAGKPIWWIILFLIPFVNIIFSIILYIDLAKNFGKGLGFALGLILLSFIFFRSLVSGMPSINRR